jgi:hypothetical protein
MASIREIKKENMTKNKIKRRDALKILTVSGLAAATTSLLPVQNVDASSHKVDGTPMQFFPKNGPDSEPFKNDVEKYPRCPYCGMKRKPVRILRVWKNLSMAGI